MSGKSRLLIQAGIFLLITICIFFLSKNIGMLWDNVLFASKMGNHLYHNGLFAINIPIEFDPGHPPFLAFLMALGWKIFGYSLTTSHLMMSPFIFGLLWQLYNLTGHFFKKQKQRIAALLLMLVDPTLSSHLFLVNPQVIQLFFFFMTINAILNQKSLYKILGLAFLGIVTFRGMMLCAGIFVFELISFLIVDRKKLFTFFTKKRILEYFIGSLPALTYVAWRLLTKGWLQSHPDSPWSACWQPADMSDFLRNIVVLVHRYFDFGRAGVFFFLVIILISKRTFFRDKQSQILLILSITSVIVIVVISLAAVNPMGHRYFISSYLSFILLAYFLLTKLSKFKTIIYSALVIILLTGNLWVYPDSIAQGWDSSLAHIPYFKLRKQAIEYMDENQVPVKETASFFPNATKIDFVDLSGDDRSFSYFTGEEKYVFYSNVYNLSDAELQILSENYRPLKQFNTYLLRVVIYQKLNT